MVLCMAKNLNFYKAAFSHIPKYLFMCFILCINLPSEFTGNTKLSFFLSGFTTSLLTLNYIVKNISIIMQTIQYLQAKHNLLRLGLVVSFQAYLKKTKTQQNKNKKTEIKQ